MNVKTFAIAAMTAVIAAAAATSGSAEVPRHDHHARHVAVRHMRRHERHIARAEQHRARHEIGR